MMNQRTVTVILVGYSMVCLAVCLVVVGLLPVQALVPLCAAAVGLARAGSGGRRWR
jgi:hypothetical protein